MGPITKIFNGLLQQSFVNVQAGNFTQVQNNLNQMAEFTVDDLTKVSTITKLRIKKVVKVFLIQELMLYQAHAVDGYAVPQLSPQIVLYDLIHIVYQDDGLLFLDDVWELYPQKVQNQVMNAFNTGGLYPWLKYAQIELQHSDNVDVDLVTIIDGWRYLFDQNFATDTNCGLTMIEQTLRN